MINKISSAYNTNIESKSHVEKTNIKEKPELSKVERIKKEIENGTYKIDLQTLSETIADELV